ncbi:MAG: tripartite tricarboxylate transporter TctB family protein [Planctomycetes bacterium]|nr:tripartite tricarboxylate transporter TctB family protein [Planctomycetota bacterium]
MRPAFFRNSSLLCAALFLCAAAAFATQFNFSKLTAQTVPLACVLIAVLAAAAESFRGANAATSDVGWNGVSWHSLAIYGAYLLGIKYLGFMIATPVFVMTIFYAIDKRRLRALGIGALFGLALTFSVHYLFVSVMGNLLPMGMFE